MKGIYGVEWREKLEYHASNFQDILNLKSEYLNNNAHLISITEMDIFEIRLFWREHINCHVYFNLMLSFFVRPEIRFSRLIYLNNRNDSGNYGSKSLSFIISTQIQISDRNLMRTFFSHRKDGKWFSCKTKKFEQFRNFIETLKVEITHFLLRAYSTNSFMKTKTTRNETESNISQWWVDHKFKAEFSYYYFSKYFRKEQ